MLHGLALVRFPRRAPVVTDADDAVVVVEQASADLHLGVRGTRTPKAGRGHAEFVEGGAIRHGTTVAGTTSPRPFLDVGQSCLDLARSISRWRSWFD